MCVDLSFFRLKSILRVLSWAIPLLAAPSGWAQSDALDCQTYSRVALGQIGIGIGMKSGGTGEGCDGVEGPRWENDKAKQFNWCLGATPAERAAETEARRQLLLACTRKRGAQKWDLWDKASYSTFTAGSGGFGSSEYGKKQCNDQGKNILEAVKQVRKDKKILHNPVKDDGFYYSRHYHHFQHWKNFSCVLIKHADGTKGHALQGYTGGGVVEKPPVDIDATKSVDPADLGIKQKPSVDIDATKPVDPADLGIKQKPRGNVF